MSAPLAPPPAADPLRETLEDRVYRSSLGEGNRAVAGASPWATVPVTVAVVALCAGLAALLGRRANPGVEPPGTVALVLQEGPEAPVRVPAGGARVPAPAPRPEPPAPAPAAPPPPTPMPQPLPPDLDSQAVPDAVPEALPREDHSRDYGGPGGGGGGGGTGGGPGPGSGPGAGEAAGGRGRVVDLPFSLVQVREQPPPPDYPPLARSAGIQGTVIVAILVGTDGIPISVRALSGPYALRPTAEAYARAMKFKPHLENGKPTAARFQLDMPFRLK